MLPRHHWQQHVATLDPETDYEEIYRIVIAHEFPWDLHQAMSFALFRTYAVPSIGRLLDDTGEFRRAPQKRYDGVVVRLATKFGLMEKPRPGGQSAAAANRNDARCRRADASMAVAVTIAWESPHRSTCGAAFLSPSRQAFEGGTIALSTLMHSM